MLSHTKSQIMQRAFSYDCSPAEGKQVFAYQVEGCAVQFFKLVKHHTHLALLMGTDDPTGFTDISLPSTFEAFELDNTTFGVRSVCPSVPGALRYFVLMCSESYEFRFNKWEIFSLRAQRTQAWGKEGRALCVWKDGQAVSVPLTDPGESRGQCVSAFGGGPSTRPAQVTVVRGSRGPAADSPAALGSYGPPLDPQQTQPGSTFTGDVGDQIGAPPPRVMGLKWVQTGLPAHPSLGQTQGRYEFGLIEPPEPKCGLFGGVGQSEGGLFGTPGHQGGLFGTPVRSVQPTPPLFAMAPGTRGFGGDLQGGGSTHFGQGNPDFDSRLPHPPAQGGPQFGAYISPDQDNAQ